MRRFFAAAGIALLAPVTAAAVFFGAPRLAAAPAEPPGPKPLSAPAAAEGPAATAARAFAGRTSQRKPVVVRLAADGKAIVRLEVTYVAECLDDTFTMELADVLYTPVAVGGDGTFEAPALGQRIALKGRIAGSRITGTIEVDAAYGMFHCRTPPITWTAAAR